MSRDGLGPGWAGYSKVPCPGEARTRAGRPCTVRSNASGVMATWGPLPTVDRQTETRPDNNFND